MKLARPIGATVAVGTVLAAVFVFFALELGSNQTRARNQIETAVNDRAVLTGSLITSLFGTLESSGGQDTALYGDPVVSPAKLDATATGNATDRYVVVTDSTGRVIAASTGFDPGAPLAVPQATLAEMAARYPTLKTRIPYYLSSVAGQGASLVTDLAVPFYANDGSVRILVTGLSLNAPTVRNFFANELRSVPGVKGEINYIIDSSGRVVSSSDPKVLLGSLLTRPSPAVLQRRSGGFQGLYFQAVALTNTSWRVLLVAPNAALFSSVEGANEYVPWVIFAALVVVALLAALLAWRVFRSAEELSGVNAQLSAANESLHRRAAELARSNEELDSFASIASHDLQEPLRKVRTFTEQLTVIERDRLSEKGQDYLERANAAAERMQRLIEDLLKFSRVSTQGRPFERVSLGEVAARVLDDLEYPISEAGARVDVGPLPTITADPLQMQQLLQNLISNALKFQRPGVAPEVTVRAEARDGILYLSVTDNGIGFEPRYAARIFRIFERLHPRTDYPGTGIGLALCRKIADRHGGTIEAEGQPDRGATFTVTLPVEQPDGSFGYGVASPRSEEVRAGAGV